LDRTKNKEMKKALQNCITGTKAIMALFVFTFISIAFTNPVNGQITVTFSQPSGIQPCQGTTLAIDAFASGGSGIYTDYEWIDPDGVILFDLSSSVILDISIPGSYSVTVIVTDDEGTQGSGTFSFTVRPGPTEATITADGPTSFCDGGSVTLFATDSPGYTYQWRRGSADIAGATNQSYVATIGGIYRVRITAPNGCALTSPAFTVTVFPNPVPDVDNTGPICENGTVQFTVLPDGMQSYQWSGPQSYTSNEQNPVLTNVALNFAGDYTVTITDNNNCSGSAVTTLIVEPLPVAPTSAQVDRNDICADDTEDITLTAIGGSGDRLVWYSGSCSGTLVGEGTEITIPVPASTTTYYARWEADGECASSACVSIQVRIRPLPVITFTNIHVSCFGENDGSSTANVTEATAPFTYSWTTDPIQTGATATNLPAGEYTVTVTDVFGCVNSETTTITEPELLEVSIGNVTHVDCNGNSTGSAQAQPTGGTPPYAYLWSNGQTSQTATGLAAGNYTVTVTDANGCQANESIQITEPDELIVSLVDATEPSCAGDSDGSITVEATGGTGDYQYNWSNGDSGATITGLVTGTYTVTVTDDNGCIAVLSIDLDEPDPLSITFIDVDDVECFGQETGSATAQPAGGTAPYTYLWSNGATGATVSGLGVGTYSVTVTDANSCIATNSVTIDENNPLVITAIVQDATCFGFEDGNILIDVSGGTGVGTYSFVWSDGTTTQNNLNIAAGDYTLTVTDANFCTAEETYTVNQPEEITATETITPVLCNEGANGAISVNIQGGTPPYSYLWSTGSTASSISGLTSGIYDLEVTDDNGCIAEFSFFVPEPDEITYDALVTDVFCASESTGAIDISNVQGGTPPYSFNWSNGATTQSISGLPAGSYTLVITDSNGCTAEETFTITEPDNALTVDVVTENVICWGDSDGSATANVSGGTPFPGGTYQYLWSNGETTQTISNLPAGIYTVTVTDANGCTAVAQGEVLQPDSPLAAFAGSNAVICSGENNGLWMLGGTGSNQTAFGGTPPYTYQWSSVPADPSLAGQENLENPVVSPNQQTVYTVMVIDAAGCIAIATATISVYPTVVADAGGDEDGNIYLCSGGSTPLGGTPLGIGNTGYYLNNPFVSPDQFEYRWDRISPNPLFISNAAHPVVSPTVTTTYRVRVRDLSGDNCIAYDFVTVVVIPVLTVVAIDDDSVCNGNNTGVSFTLGATISGGTGIPENYVITWTANPPDPTLAGQENLLNPVVSPVVTTTYTITVTDAEGIACEASDDVTITVFPEIIADAGSDETICNGSNGGSYVLGGSPTAQYADGSAGSFTYEWTSVPVGFTSSDPNPEVSPTETTTYFLTVTDANGCQEFDEVTVTVLDELIADAGDDIEICHPENGGVTQLNGSASGGTPGYTYLWEPADGLDNPNIANPIANPTATTVYTLTVTDAFGCTDTDQVTITVIDEIVAEITGDDQMCHPDDSGFATLTGSATGGSGNFTFLWSADPAYDFEGNENNAIIVVSPAETTTFTLTVTDTENGCADSTTFEVVVLEALQIVLDADENLCHPDNTETSGTTITANVSGGSGDYSYLWSTGETTQSIFVEPAATTTYTVTVIDNETGCFKEESILITVFDELFADAGADQTACFESEVNLQGSALGGSGSGYTYSWSPETGLSDPNIANPVFISPEDMNEGEVITFTLTVTDDNGCIATDEVTITVLPQIILDPGADQHVCFGDEVTLGGTPTANGGSGNFNYLWTLESDGSFVSDLPNPTITIDFTGSQTYILEVYDTDGDCYRYEQVTITVVDEPVVVIVVSDDEVCEGSVVTLTASGAANYLWTSDPEVDFGGNENQAQINVVVTETTTFYVEGTNLCGSDVAEVTITVIPGPVVDLGADQEACDGETVILDAGEFVNVEYLWSDGSTEQTLEVTETGIYSVTVTSLDTGCSSTSQVLVTFNPLPEAFTGDDQTICYGDEVMLGNDGDTEPIPANTYLWTSDPEDPSISDPTISNPIVSPTVTTTYTLVETYIETGCTNTNTVVVYVVGGLPNAGEDQTICAGESVILGPDEPIEGNQYTWTSSNEDEVFDNNVPNPVVTPMVTTTYTLVEIYTEYGCVNTDSVVITVNPSPFAETGPDLDICLGDTVTLGTEYTEPMPLNTYLWTSEPEDPSISDPTVSNPTVSPSVTTTYTLTEVYVQTGCTTQNTVVVTVHEIPVAEVIDDRDVCESEEIFLGSDSADPSLSYYWSSIPEGFASTEANPSVVPGFYPLDENNQITFILEVSSEFCSATAEVVITVLPDPVPDISEDIVFCSPDEAVNIAIGGEAIPGYTYLWTSDQDENWSSTDANPVVSPQVTTVYTLFVTDTETGCSVTREVLIYISDLLLETITDPSICEDVTTIALGDYIEISGGTAPYQFFWTDDDGNDISTEENPVISAPFSSQYNLMVMDQMGCMATTSLQINIIETPDVVLYVSGSPAGASQALYLGQTVTFEALPAGFDLYEFYIYDENGTQDVNNLTPEQSGTSNIFTPLSLSNGQWVFVRAYNEGCMGESQWVLIVINDLPNAFTPDGDGINDIFAVGFELTVFNRWGQKVYEGTKGWDGTYNGRKVSPGTYYYLVNVYDENNSRTTLKGSVTVIINNQ
jgi:gliding motility-associated-like protein